MKIIKPRSEIKMKKSLHACELENEQGLLTTVDNFYNGDDLIFKVSRNAAGYYFFIFNKENKCVCYTEFLDRTFLKRIYRLKHSKLYEPHCDVTPEYRGKGFASFFYSLFLKNNPDTALMTVKHTLAAEKLWLSVANKNNTTVRHWHMAQRTYVDVPSEFTIKILSLE